MVKPYVSEEVLLDPEMRSPEVLDFERRLLSKVVGQDRAVRRIVNMYQIYLAGMTTPGHPVGNLLFLGPTGSGKTRVVEASAEILFGSPRAFIKIDCAEFQHSHEIAKLIGSPPGYLGHRETPPLLTQENLAKYQTESNPFTLVLFDEVEKASDALWQLLLGILDKATLTLGDNRRVDFSKAMIFLTSNLGAKEMSELITGTIGFAPARGKAMVDDEIDKKIYKTALEAARRKFSPEFMNRIDKVVVFRSLRHEEMTRILDLELQAVQRRIDSNKRGHFTFNVSDQAKEFLLDEGTNYQYGARHLKRAIERHVVYPFASLLASGQVRSGDAVVVDLDKATSKLIFSREDTLASIPTGPLGSPTRGGGSRIAA